MSKQWQAYARHILDTIAKIRRIEERGDFTQDEVLYDAILRNLQTLSEATQYLPESMKTPFSGVPWKEISGFRNILVHNYLGNIDPGAIRTVVQRQLQPLEEAVRAMLDTDPGTLA